MKPRNLLVDTVELGVMFAAADHVLILFDCIDSLPSTRTSKGDGIAANARKAVDENSLVGRCTS